MQEKNVIVITQQVVLSPCILKHLKFTVLECVHSK